MNINSLPDDVLRHIFTILPLLDQVHLHHVCPRWKSLQPTVTSTRKCLTLLIGKRTNPSPRSLITESSLTIPHLDQIDSDSAKVNPPENTLVFSVLNLSLATHLVSLFPDIKSLCLVLNRTGYETVDQVIRLLETWCKSIESLSFYCHFAEPSDGDSHYNESSKKLFSLIRFIDEHCLALDCLTFDVAERLYRFKGMPGVAHDLPCLARLKEFKFCSDDKAEILFASLKQYGTSDRLEKISLGNLIHSDVDDVMTEFAQHPHIAAKFISLPSVHFSSMLRYPQLFATFNSLTELSSVLVDNFTLPSFSAYLAQLHSLLYLDLLIFSKSLSRYDSTPTYQFHSLPSVKILRLTLLDRTHTRLATRHWSTIFPSIQFVEIFTLDTPCKVCPPIYEPTTRQLKLQSFRPIDPSIEHNQKKQCWKMLLGTLKQFNQLKKIVTCIGCNVNDSRKEWTIEELN